MTCPSCLEHVPREQSAQGLRASSYPASVTARALDGTSEFSARLIVPVPKPDSFIEAEDESTRTVLEPERLNFPRERYSLSRGLDVARYGAAMPSSGV